ncbi:MAG: amidohydrolase family protein [Bacteroidota bacterium]|nr:amidohydrolase family protein [Bacteroidota bacterium]
MKSKLWLFISLIIGMAVQTVSGQANTILLKHVTLIDGTGSPAKKNMNILLEGDHIVSITKRNQAESVRTRVIDLTGKTIMPALICAHAHLGVLKGTSVEASNYTRKNILDQLKKYERYGVGSVLCMGTDRQMIFPGFRDSSKAGLLPGARLYSAGHGFSTPGGPPGGSWTDQLFRPANPGQVRAEMDSLAALHPDVVKIWLDDFGGHSAKMKPEIYQAIIREAHKHGLRVAAHLYYLEDARKLVDAGLDIIAHSIRDQVIDTGLLNKMKKNGVIYIPTLTRDEFTYVYADHPDWINESFFKSSLEPGVYEMISSKAYQDKVRNSPDYKSNRHAVEIAMKNLKKIFDAGIVVAMGTDSGADPVRAQGFSEHQELELMVEAGLTPLEAIEAGTKNAALGLKINNQYGTLEPGKKADFIVLSENPEHQIKNSRKIESVWKNAAEVSKGPLPDQ